MVSKRIKFISSLINKEDIVLDIGTDHALLPIYLIKNGISKIADGSDISSNVLENAKKNISKYHLDNDINLYCADGIKGINISKYNTFVITGMGYFTIKSILDNNELKSVNKLIIQSNNNHEDLRRFLNSIGYKIIKDYYIIDRKKPYLIVLAVKGKQKLSDIEYVCGLYDSNNIWYYKYMFDKYKSILSSIPGSNNDNINSYITYYSSYLSKEKTED